MTNGQLFLVEGLDLAGKTTACKSLVSRFRPRIDISRNAFAENNPLFKVADDLRRVDGLESKYLGHAYLAAAALDVDLYSPPINARIQESTIALRSLCYYRARGNAELAGSFARLLDDPSYPNFDDAVVLTASLDARQERLEMRRREAPEEVAPDDLAVIQTPELFCRMENILIDEMVIRYGAKVIDTTILSRTEVVDAIATAIAPADS